MLNAAKTLSQGLRDLSGSVAYSLSGNMSTSPVTNSYMHMAGGFHRSDSSNSINSTNSGDVLQPGIVTIVDVEVCATCTFRDMARSLVDYQNLSSVYKPKTFYTNFRDTDTGTLSRQNEQTFVTSRGEYNNHFPSLIDDIDVESLVHTLKTPNSIIVWKRIRVSMEFIFLV